MTDMDEKACDRAAVLLLLRQEPGRAWTVGDMMSRLGMSEREVRHHIDRLRKPDFGSHNIRNKWQTKLFWLEDGPAPLPGPTGRASDRWQGEPPDQAVPSKSSV